MLYYLLFYSGVRNKLKVSAIVSFLEFGFVPGLCRIMFCGALLLGAGGSIDQTRPDLATNVPG